MIYLALLAMLGFVFGLVAVASNPSPYFAAFGLVLAAVCGCWVLVELGISFLSLVLLLIYLGGMLVVFAYSASLAAEPYPEAWGSWSVLIYVFLYFVLMSLGYFFFNCNMSVEFLFTNYNIEYSAVGNDWGGIGMMYSFGGWFLVLSGWVLLLTLFVVLEVTRGLSYGSLRAVT
uniref:NADH-ubiquinone oxidoreductase chain 6 n=1 Tax=Onychodactylus zhaoermii TaxID=1248184 RepID=A0A0E3DEJ9_9AMPH|nr:NADH dehydrogenase subunit 6 [Onychodactylus zhaoermii]AIC83081.1 NADH dehydrogenase subunit 6 [Onychodactylus zhaoermii]UHM25436.1 NADH dehydrogenase subunit 6 [Onychodactylus zhaoermii]UHM25449.1 NADH dehydrogenase subunit 6 [Onychodactylus zhaoermii]UHM25462.1 NADH dehydrogenase subunit 6 [Onychodactylus zhaoermii]UHM25475.1 NADH dehydrogenase subunit 6 [Onychodactylus zhaoermii]